MKPRIPFLLVGVALVTFTSTARADAPASTASAPPPEKRMKPRVMADVDAGLAYRALYGSHVWGGELSAAVGAELEPGAILLTSDLLFGATEFGLRVWSCHVAPLWQFRLARLRLGAGPSVSYLQIARITEPGHALWNLGVGVVGQASFDLLQLDTTGADGRPTPPHAFYGAVRLNVDDVLGTGAPIVYGPTFALGLRL